MIKDSFTLYEVFLEDSAHHLLLPYGSGLNKLQTEDSWKVFEYQDFYKKYLGADIKSPEIEDIQWIRNKLSHLRDSLRTNEGKAEFAEKIEALGIVGDATTDENELNLPH